MKHGIKREFRDFGGLVRRIGRLMAQAPKPAVTIGIPTRNRPQLVRELLDGLIAQCPGSCEFLVSDNSTNQETHIALKDLDDSRVRYIRQVFPIDLVQNYNETLRHARGKYFVWLPDDDRLEDGYIEQMLEIMETYPEAAFAAGHGRYISDTGEMLEPPALTLELMQLLGTTPQKLSLEQFVDGFCAAMLGVSIADKNPYVHFCTSGFFVRTEDLRRVGGFPNIDGGYFADIIVALELMANEKIVIQQGPKSYLYRLNPQTYVHQHRDVATDILRHLQLYREVNAWASRNKDRSGSAEVARNLLQTFDEVLRRALEDKSIATVADIDIRTRLDRAVSILPESAAADCIDNGSVQKAPTDTQ